MRLSKRSKRLLLIADALKNNFSSYINIHKLSKDTHVNWKTAQSYVLTLEDVGFFTVPMCEWHDEQQEVEHVG